MLTTQTGEPEATKARKKRGPNKPKTTGQKNENKNIRASLGAETTPNKMSDADQIQSALGKQKNMDWDHYTRMPEYEGMTLFGCLDTDVDKWIQLGAEPVAKRAKARKIFKGINDNPDTAYEYVVTGTDEHGNSIKTYLLFMPEARYHALKIQPLINRNEAIQQSMGMGMLNNEGEKVMPDVGGIRTYAPLTTVRGEKVGDGSKGLSTVTTHNEPTFAV